MSKSTKSNRKSKAGGGQASNRPKHRAPSDSLIDLNSSADETPPITAPNKRAKADNQTVMDLDHVVAEGSTSTTTPSPTQEIVFPTAESAVQQESAASSNIQQTPKIHLSIQRRPPNARSPREGWRAPRRSRKKGPRSVHAAGPPRVRAGGTARPARPPRQ